MNLKRRVARLEKVAEENACNRSNQGTSSDEEGYQIWRVQYDDTTSNPIEARDLLFIGQYEQVLSRLSGVYTKNLFVSYVGTAEYIGEGVASPDTAVAEEGNGNNRQPVAA